jgi:aromatic-L-amino-acid decarboxylase
VCFRAEPEGVDEEDLDRFNERLMDAVNATGNVFTRLDGQYTLRMAICNLRTTEKHVRTAWDLLRREATRLKSEHRC